MANLASGATFFTEIFGAFEYSVPSRDRVDLHNICITYNIGWNSYDNAKGDFNEDKFMYLWREVLLGTNSYFCLCEAILTKMTSYLR